MKKSNIAQRALAKIGIGKRHVETTTSYQPPHASPKLDRKLKRRHLSNFARQCAAYISEVLAKRKAAKAARLRGTH